MQFAMSLRRRVRSHVFQATPDRYHRALAHLLGRYGPVRNPGDLVAMAKFLGPQPDPWPLRDRLRLLAKFVGIPFRVDSFHTHGEMLQIVSDILSFGKDQPGCIVEAGCFKGGSTAKLSLAASMTGRRLFVFDSFAGLPPNSEPHETTMYGGKIDFSGGQYCGTLNEVKDNVRRHGAIDACTFVPGWFQDTMPSFAEPVLVAFVDVDLVSSTATCLKCLYPLLAPGGIVYSQDGHIPLVAALLNDARFWREDVGVDKPVVEGLGARKLVRILGSDPR
jgi:O-methyltransferase